MPEHDVTANGAPLVPPTGASGQHGEVLDSDRSAGPLRGARSRCEASARENLLQAMTDESSELQGAVYFAFPVERGEG